MLRPCSGRQLRLVLAAIAATGCATLPDIPGEQCGNHILDANEDCEPKDANDTTCGQPGTASACQLTCSASTACADPSFRCGLDGICRRPAFAWGAPASLGGGLAAHVAIADFDGDGQGDLLSVVPPAVEVSYFDSTGAVLATASVIAPEASPAVGDLSTDYACAAISPGPMTLGWSATTPSAEPHVASFTLDVSDGLGVVNGTSTGDLQPAVFTSSLVQFYLTALPIDVYPLTGQFPNFTLLMVNAGDPTMPPQANAAPAPFVLATGTGKIPQVGTFPGVDSANGAPLAGLVVGKFYDALHLPEPACDLFVAAIGGQNQVLVYDICTGTAASPAFTDKTNMGTPIALPMGAAVCPAGCDVTRPLNGAVAGANALHLFDQNHDGIPDLVITGVAQDPKHPNDPKAKTGALFVAYATGDGHFESAPGLLDDSAALYLDASDLSDGQQPGFMTAIQAPPLALADLNGDCVLDFINGNGVWLSQGGGPAPTCKGADVHVLPPATPILFLPNDLTVTPGITAAAIVDFNGDGRPDAVLGSQTLAGLTAYLGTPEGLLDPFKLETVGGVKNFAVGDFNGDLLADLAFAQVGDADPTSGSTPDTVSVVYGAATGGPSAPVDLGVIDDTVQLLTVDQLDISDAADSDIWAVSQTGDATMVPASISLFIGSGDGQLQAPYFVITEAGGSGAGIPDFPQVSAVGQLDDCAHGDVALIGTAPPMMTMSSSAPPPHLWILPSRGATQIHPIGLANMGMGPVGDPIYMPLPAEFGPQGKSPTPENALMRTVNLGPNPGTPTDTDEVVAVSTVDCLVLGKSSASTVLSARRTAADSTNATWALGNVTGSMTSPVATALPGFTVPAELGRIGGDMVVADVDGDGKDDVVIASGVSGLLVIYNDGGAQLALDKTARLSLDTLGGGPADPAHPCVGDAKSRLIGVAALQLDAGPAKQLLVVRESGAYVVRRRSDGTFAATPLGALGGVAVAVGDINGDRIDDLVLAQLEAPPVVMLGLALLPGGQPPKTTPVALADGGAP